MTWGLSGDSKPWLRRYWLRLVWAMLVHQSRCRYACGFSFSNCWCFTITNQPGYRIAATLFIPSGSNPLLEFLSFTCHRIMILCGLTFEFTVFHWQPQLNTAPLILVNSSKGETYVTPSLVSGWDVYFVTGRPFLAVRIQTAFLNFWYSLRWRSWTAEK